MDVMKLNYIQWPLFNNFEMKYLTVNEWLLELRLES